MYPSNTNQYTAKDTEHFEDYVILPGEGFGAPPITISTLIIDADNEKAEGATISVIENPTNYSIAQADGMVYLQEVQSYQNIQVNYAGAVLKFKATEVPTIVQFGSNMLDTVIINAPKKKSNWLPKAVIGLSLAGILYTVGKAIKEEEPLKAVL